MFFNFIVIHLRLYNSIGQKYGKSYLKKTLSTNDSYPNLYSSTKWDLSIWQLRLKIQRMM